MELMDLPEEIVLMIIRKLDFCSLRNLYNTSKWARNMVCMCRVKKCELSRSVMGTANTLKQNLFKDISQHLRELNMRCVPDLCKTVFIPAVKKLKNLKTLDVAYTNLHIIDLIEIYRVCPSLKDITINFQFGKVAKISNDILTQCQSLFENFENIHFVGSVNSLLNFKLGYCVLAKAQLCNLTYSLAESCLTYSLINDNLLPDVKVPQFHQHIIYVLDWKFKRTPLYHNVYYMKQIPMLAMLELELQHYQYVIMLLEYFDPKVYASQIFKNFFKENFNIDSTCIPEDDIQLLGNVVFMFWHKDSVNVDNHFYHTLREHIEQYFPCHVKSQSGLEMSSGKLNWFYAHPTPNDSVSHRNKMRVMKKKRVAAPDFVIDYDVIFENKSKIELSLIFKYPIINTIALKEDCNYLRKLTYLSLVDFSRYSSNFFKILFKCCDNLLTLNVESSPVSPCLLAISQSLPLSRCLKNIRLVEKRIDFKTLFASLSRCPTLENIHVVDKSIYENDIPDPSILIKKCNKLVNVYIEALMNSTSCIRITRQFKKAKIVYKKPYINFMVQCDDKLVYKYDPFVEVFKLSPLIPV